MSVVAINALTVPAEAGTELEKRFAERKHAVDSAPGFEGFQLLRPTDGSNKYFVYTQWASREDFETWKNNRTPAHASGRKPVAEGAELMEFEVVDLED